MSNVYQEKPNIVQVTISDNNGTAERFVVGKSLDEVIAIISPDGGAVAVLRAPKKDRKPRSPNKPKSAPAPEKQPDAAAAEKPQESVWP